MDRASGRLQRTRAEGAATAGHGGRVGVDELDVRHRDSELLADEHRKRGVVALSVHARPGEGGCGAVVVNLHRTPLDVEPDGRCYFHVGGDADAELDGILCVAATLLLGTQFGVPRRLQRRVERLLVFAGVVRGTGVRRQRERAGLNEVSATDLGRVHADLVSSHIEDSLDQLRGFGPARSAVGADRRVVRHHGAGDELDLVDRVHTDGHHLREHRKDRTDDRVGTRGCGHVALEAGDLSVFRDAELGRHHEVTAVYQRDHVFGAGLGPLHRLAELHCDRGDSDVLHIDRGLRAESAAYPRAQHAKVLRLHADRRCNRAVRRVRCLMRQPQLETVAFRLGKCTVVLHRRAGQALADHGDFGDLVGTFERVHVGAVLGSEAHVRTVLLEQQRRACSKPFVGSVDHFQGCVVDNDGVCGVGRGGLRRCHDGGDDVTDEADLVSCKHRPIQRRRHHRETLEAGQTEIIPAGVVHADDAGHCSRILRVDRHDVGVRVLRAHETHMQQTGGGQVVEVLPAAREEGGVLQPLDAVPQDRTCCCHGVPSLAMKRTDCTIGLVAH